MTILLTGADGYCGWPVFLKLAKEFPNERIVGVDNFARRQWVKEVGAISAIPIADIETRLDVAREHGFTNMTFIEGDLTNRAFVDELFCVFKPQIIVHVAAQPSMPYAQINGERAHYTQWNNNTSTRNILWGMRENGLLESLLIETTTTGVYGAPEFEIPEGFIEVEYKGGRDTILFPGMAGSWYHMSKSADVSNLWLANKQWQLSIVDLRTAIVYGTATEETSLDQRLSTRFDFDFYFGVVGNRFIAQALAGYPITIYGKGEQRKPTISLQDMVNSTAAAVRRGANGGRFEVFNQVTAAVSILRWARAIQKGAALVGVEVEIIHVPNPRKEKEGHKMVINNDGLRRELLPEQAYDIESGLEQALCDLVPHKGKISQYTDTFLPPALQAATR